MLTIAAIVPLLAQEENTRSMAAKLIAGRGAPRPEEKAP
jgi:hypothetical protein